MPTVLQLERGTRSHHAQNKAEPELAPLAHKVPAGMTGRARVEWIRLVTELTEKGVLTVGDLVVFETYCNLVGQVATMQKKVAKVGIEVSQRLGYFNALNKLRAQQKQYAAELGLTPSSRSGVKAVKRPGDAAAAAKHQRFFGNRNAG